MFKRTACYIVCHSSQQVLYSSVAVVDRLGGRSIIRVFITRATNCWLNMHTSWHESVVTRHAQVAIMIHCVPFDPARAVLVNRYRRLSCRSKGQQYASNMPHTVEPIEAPNLHTWCHEWVIARHVQVAIILHGVPFEPASAVLVNRCSGLPCRSKHHTHHSDASLQSQVWTYSHNSHCKVPTSKERQTYISQSNPSFRKSIDDPNENKNNFDKPSLVFLVSRMVKVVTVLVTVCETVWLCDDGVRTGCIARPATDMDVCNVQYSNCRYQSLQWMVLSVEAPATCIQHAINCWSHSAHTICTHKDMSMS